MQSDHIRPFDLEADEAHDITQQFWGKSRTWTPRAGVRSETRGEPTGSFEAVRSGLGLHRRPTPQQRNRVGGTIDRTRTHGIIRPRVDDVTASESGQGRDATLGELAAGWGDEPLAHNPTPRSTRLADPSQRREVPTSRLPVASRRSTSRHLDNSDDLVPLTPVAQLGRRLGLGAVDPLLARLGAIVLIGVLLVPFARALRPDVEAIAGAPAALAVGELASASQSASAAVAPLQPTAIASPGPASVIATEQVAATDDVQPSSDNGAQAPANAVVAPTGNTASGASVAAPPTTALDPAGDIPQSADPGADQAIAQAAAVSTPPARVEPECSLRYEAGYGDSWYRIADAAGVGPNALMEYNLANVDTTILPGDEICLPAGAKMPSQPTTTTAAPSTTASPTTTQAPATTAAPAVTAAPAAPPVKRASTSEVQQLIRDIWPDELEDKALAIAFRESRYIATAYNGSCCYGVFQIHWGAHKSWLDDYGITTTNDLFDARKNITAAYAIYQRAGGWGPWGG
jgi:LysM repeat protein